MSYLKSLWAKWKVSMSFVGGALVVATAYGTCTVEPNKEAILEEVSKEKSEEAPKEEAKPEPKEEAKEESKEAPKEESQPEPKNDLDNPVGGE